jgi:tetratricopeptide (TPR) repeat protein
MDSSPHENKDVQPILNKIASLIAEGEVDDAARLAEKEGLLDKAIVLYEKCSDFRSLGRVYEKLNQLKKAMLAYERGKLYQEAARVAEALGEKRKAERFYNLYQKQEFTPYGH